MFTWRQFYILHFVFQQPFSVAIVIIADIILLFTTHQIQIYLLMECEYFVCEKFVFLYHIGKYINFYTKYNKFYLKIWSSHFCDLELTLMLNWKYCFSNEYFNSSAKLSTSNFVGRMYKYSFHVTIKKYNFPYPTNTQMFNLT